MLARSNLLTRLWRVRVAACLSALWVVFGAPLAHAVTLVPMCGEHADTVVAPPIQRPASDAMLRPGACDERGAQVARHGGLPEKAPERVTPGEGTPRLLPIYFHLPPVPRGLEPLDVTRVGERPGFRSGIERPPR